MTSCDFLDAFNNMSVAVTSTNTATTTSTTSTYAPRYMLPTDFPLSDQYNGPALLSDDLIIERHILKNKITNMSSGRQEFLMKVWHNIRIFKCTYSPIIHEQLDSIIQEHSNKSMKKCSICKYDVPMMYFMKGCKELKTCGSCRALRNAQLKAKLHSSKQS